MRTLGLIISIGLGLTTVAQAQPWRVVKNGRVTYTSNIEDLPPEARARVLEKWRNADGKIVPPKAPEREPAVTPETDPDRFPKVGLDAIDQKKLGDKDAKAEVAAPPAVDPREEAAREVAELQTALAAAQVELDQKRRKAYEVPSGQAYEARNQAENALRELESKLSAAKVRAGM